MREALQLHFEFKLLAQPAEPFASSVNSGCQMLDSSLALLLQMALQFLDLGQVAQAWLRSGDRGLAERVFKNVEFGQTNVNIANWLKSLPKLLPFLLPTPERMRCG